MGEGLLRRHQFLATLGFLQNRTIQFIRHAHTLTGLYLQEGGDSFADDYQA